MLKGTESLVLSQPSKVKETFSLVTDDYYGEAVNICSRSKSG